MEKKIRNVVETESRCSQLSDERVLENTDQSKFTVDKGNKHDSLLTEAGFRKSKIDD